jgi:hypothetical protein
LTSRTAAGWPEPASSQTFDLTACDREQIRVPGAIQPHGALLVIGVGDGVVRSASMNAAAVLGVEDALGLPLEACSPALAAVVAVPGEQSSPLLRGQWSRAPGVLFDVFVRVGAIGGSMVYALEGSLVGGQTQARQVTRLLGPTAPVSFLSAGANPRNRWPAALRMIESYQGPTDEALNVAQGVTTGPASAISGPPAAHRTALIAFLSPAASRTPGGARRARKMSSARPPQRQRCRAGARQARCGDGNRARSGSPGTAQRSRRCLSRSVPP